MSGSKAQGVSVDIEYFNIKILSRKKTAYSGRVIGMITPFCPIFLPAGPESLAPLA